MPSGPSITGRVPTRSLHLLVLTLLIALIPWLTAAPAHAADNSVLGIVVRTVTPVVAGAGDPITLQLDVSNSASSPSAPTTLNVLLGTERLDDTAAVDAWAAGHQAASGRLVAQTEVPAIPAGSVTPLTVTLARAGDLTRRPYDVVALSLEIGSAITHTFVGVQRAKEFEPLSVAWLVPVTLDAQPGLWTSPSVDRWHAWEDALADDSRIGRLITATRGTEVTLAVDAGLLTPVAQASAPAVAPGATPTPSATPTPRASPQTDTQLQALDPLEAEAIVRNRATSRLRAALADRHPILLAAGDPDLAALTDNPDPAVALAQQQATTLASDLGGRADVAWPVDPRYSDDAANRYAAALGQRPAATIVDRDRLAWRLDQGSAGRKSRSEVPLLARASALSAAAGQAMVAETAGAARQLFLAHSLTLLQESPGLARTVLVAPDRGLDADPTALNELLTFARSVPWLSSTTVSTLIDQAAGADAVTTAASGDEAPIPVSPLSPAVRTHLTELGAEAGEVGDIRSDGASIQADVTARIAALTSSAWRGHEEAFGVVMQGLTQEITANRNAVRVADQTINFLADSGRVQITVVNSLDVPVRGVRVQLVPQRPILRIAQDTKVVDIGANSRTTVTYAVDALAAGNVRLEARVTGPTGRAVGPTTSMLVRATPTGAGIYWVLGGVILVVFALGLWRNRRQRRRAAATGATTPNVVQVDDDGDVIEQARIARDHEPEVDRADTVEERA